MSTEHTTAQVDEAMFHASLLSDPTDHRFVLAAEVRRLRDERENWRVSSVAREAVARAEQAEAKIAQIARRIDSMSSVHHAPGFTGGTLAILDDIYARHVSLTEDINDSEAKIAALVSAGDRLRSSVGNFTIYREVASACAQWDAARSQEAQR